ncbi:NAD(P)-binding protein [Hymenopellis radicata]|nr:NAD(P)-binding protein [Hymenopellis radicata]
MCKTYRAGREVATFAALPLHAKLRPTSHNPYYSMTPATSNLVFVTGGSGFLGAHILLQLLEAGYDVRAAARGVKVQDLERAHTKYGARLEVVDIPDIAVDQFPEALEGVSAVIHTASPLPTRNSPADMLKGAIEGTLNVVRQAERAGIKKIIVTSSRATLGLNHNYTDQDWNPITPEQALHAEGFSAYNAAKTLAERALWKFADEHPDMDVTTINPPFIYGPLTETFYLPEPRIGTYPRDPHYADVRDVARAHILALKAPSEVGRKRFIFAAPHDLDFNYVRELIEMRRPHLESRWIRQDVPSYPSLHLPYSMERLEKVLGMKREDFTSLESTILDSVDSLVDLEMSWVKEGYHVEMPTLVDV